MLFPTCNTLPDVLDYFLLHFDMTFEKWYSVIVHVPAA